MQSVQQMVSQIVFGVAIHKCLKYLDNLNRSHWDPLAANPFDTTAAKAVIEHRIVAGDAAGDFALQFFQLALGDEALENALVDSPAGGLEQLRHLAALAIVFNVVGDNNEFFHLASPFRNVGRIAPTFAIQIGDYRPYLLEQNVTQPQPAPPEHLDRIDPLQNPGGDLVAGIEGEHFSFHFQFDPAVDHGKHHPVHGLRAKLLDEVEEEGRFARLGHVQKADIGIQANPHHSLPDLAVEYAVSVVEQGVDEILGALTDAPLEIDDFIKQGTNDVPISGGRTSLDGEEFSPQGIVVEVLQCLEFCFDLLHSNQFLVIFLHEPFIEGFAVLVVILDQVLLVPDLSSDEGRCQGAALTVAQGLQLRQLQFDMGPVKGRDPGEGKPGLFNEIDGNAVFGGVGDNGAGKRNVGRGDHDVFEVIERSLMENLPADLDHNPFLRLADKGAGARDDQFEPGAVKEDVAFLGSPNFVYHLSLYRFLRVQRDDLWSAPIAAVA